MPETSNGAKISLSDAHEAWLPAAREVLMATARTYGGWITYKELARSVQEATGITTSQRLDYWIGGLLEMVSDDAERRGEPRLTSLCVRADQSIGSGYPWARDIDDDWKREEIAAQDRLECYRRYALDFRAEGGVPMLTPSLEKRLERQRRADARAADVALPASWLVASNGRTFNSDAAFASQEKLDWSETRSAGIKVGDTVYLYGTAPISALTHECLVVETGVSFDRIIDDREYWTDKQALVDRAGRTWMRLQRIRTFSQAERARLSLAELGNHGLRAAPQGRMRVPEGVAAFIETLAGSQGASDDNAAESSPADEVEVSEYRVAIARKDFAVPDQLATIKTRGSAQRAFAESVKRNYGYQCAVTGVRTRAFLVASHIVPWAEDQSIRLDPSNGICLSTMVDRAFDTGYLSITAESKVVVHHDRLQDDPVLGAMLNPFDGVQLLSPIAAPPDPDYLKRRIATAAQNTARA